MEHIKDILNDVIEQLESPEKKGPRKVSMIWKDIVGDMIARHTKPSRIKRKILYVNVDESTWVYELNQKYKKSLITRLNNALEDYKIHDIYFRVGNIS